MSRNTNSSNQGSGGGGGGLPPPPRMTGSRPQRTSTPNRTPGSHSLSPPPPPPHSNNNNYHHMDAANLPPLESAPPSGTAHFEAQFEELAQVAGEQLRAAVDVLSGTGLSVSTTSSSAGSEIPDHWTNTPSPRKRPSVVPPSSTLPRPPPMPPPSHSIHPPSTLPPPPLPLSSASQSPLEPPPSAPTLTTTTDTTTNGTPPYLPRHHSRLGRSSKPQSQSASQSSSVTATTVPPVTAARQEDLPVLVVATAAAHTAAHKNGLQLVDLLQGLVGSAEQTPFQLRSVTKSITLSTKMTISFQDQRFTEGVTDEGAAEILQQAAALELADGNLPAELELLEDQIDNLLSDEDPPRGHGKSGSSDSGSAANNASPTKQQQQQNASSRHMDDAFRHATETHDQTCRDAYKLTSPLSIPWLCRYRAAADRTTDHLPHDQFHCPAIVLCVATTDDDDQSVDNAHTGVIEVLRALQNQPHYLPASFRNGLFDPDRVRKEALVLHDNVRGPSLDEPSLQRRLRQAFGTSAQVIRINSLPDATAAQLALEEESDAWGGGGKLGTCLTVADTARLRQYLGQLVSTSILPALERRVADLNVIVSDRKKGVKNVLKSFWGGRKKEDEDSSTATPSTMVLEGGVVAYRFDSIESQTRLLADTLFLLKDYEAAHSMYRLIKDDFKQDKNWIHYASVNEMMALSLYCLDPYGRAKEIFTSMENALLSYSRAAEESQKAKWGEKTGRAGHALVATRLATRLCLVLTSTRNVCSGKHLEVADMLASASSHETALGAAVLLEQSSSHYYKASMYRKYAFHMLMSGHMFRSAEQEHHAFRCFTSALYIYRNGKWEELHNHLRSALAAQLFSMGRMAISLQLYAKLVGSSDGGRVSVKSQQKFVNNLLEICKDHRKKALVAADRMAAPANLSGSDRDAARAERLDRIVQVIRYTKSASRKLELPNMNLPFIDDSTVSVLAEEAAHYRQESVPHFGEAHVGTKEVWDDLMMMVTAELNASSGAEVTITKTLAKIDDPDIRRIVAFVEKEKSHRAKLKRSTRSATYKDSAPVRALKEPVSIEFEVRNPLGLQIKLCDLQLVAKMTGENGDQVCTNEDSVYIRPFVDADVKQKWTFQSSDVEFSIADFCRVSARSRNSDKEAWKSAEDVEPFFVVTRLDMTLEPDSRKTVLLSICPLALGNLEVLGVRCRLFDDIWVYHPFAIKGPLLQNTRSNRANRVRGESFLLKSKVEQGMPCLTVDLINAASTPPDGPVLQNQVGKWLLRIANVGTSPASSVSLKTNLPWIKIEDCIGATDRRERDPVFCCISPTGTLMSIPLVGKGLSENGHISPGETIDIPVEMKTSGIGNQEIYLLFRYELSQNLSSEPVRCRWLKKMFVVPVYPSLTMVASVAPCFNSVDEHVMTIDLTNCRTDRPHQLELSMGEISMASRYYRIEPIPFLLSDQAHVGWQERITLQYKLIRQEIDSPTLLSSYSMAKASDPKLFFESVDTTGKLSFLCIEKAHERFLDCCRLYHMAVARAAASQGDDDFQPRSIASIRRSNTTDVSKEGKDISDYKKQPTSIEELCPTEGAAEYVHVRCSWSGHSDSIKGYSDTRGLLVRPSFLAQDNCPIILSASHPDKVSNNFQCGPATVQLFVTLQNALLTSPVCVEFEVDQSDLFDFTGPVNYSTSLVGGQTISIPLKAQIATPGVFNLQRVRLTVVSENRISYKFPLQWLVSVDSI